MADLAAISAVTSSLRATFELSQAMLGLRDAEKMRLKTLELIAQIISAQERALSAQAAQAELVQREDDLKKRLVQMEDWNSEKARYELNEVASGVFVYATKPGMEAGEPAHRICANCYQRSQKSVLQAFSKPSVGGRTNFLRCDNCSAVVPISFTPDPARTYRRGPRSIA